MANRHAVFVPKPRDFSESLLEHDVLFYINELVPGSLLKIETRNSTYFALVEDPGRGIVILQGGSYLDRTRWCFFNGSTLGGSSIRHLGFALGLRLEFMSDRGNCFITSEAIEIDLIDDRETADRLRQEAAQTLADEPAN